MAETRGRRPTYTDYKDLRKKVDEYFDKCAEVDEFPDEKGMLLHLRIFKDDVDALVDDSNENAYEFQRIFEIAKYRRESWLSRHMVADNKKANGCMNALKQEQNGGYADRSADRGKQQTLNIKIDGVGGWDAFK